MSAQRSDRESNPLAFGIVLIVLGTLFLVDRWSGVEFGHVIRDWWPLIVIGVGVTRLVAREVWNGLWLVAVGSWLLAVELELFGFTYRNSWPLLLIVLGGGMVLRALFQGLRRGERHGA